jgi:hypothetical protein
VSIVLETISVQAKENKKLAIHATFNAYSELIVNEMGSKHIQTYAMRILNELVCPVIVNLP